LRGDLPWSRVLYMGDVVVDVVVSAEWSRMMLSRDNGGWRSGVGASGHCGERRRYWSEVWAEETS
jgi:hypothetical protein